MSIKEKLIEFECKHRVVPDTITSNLTSLVGKVGIACAGVVAAGLTIFGLKWAVTKVMSFFKAIGK